jgi:PAS domain S-box-containing protein
LLTQRELANPSYAMKRSLTRQINIGLGVALGLLAVNAAISYRNTLKLIENEQSVSHTHQVLAKLEQTISTLKDAETGQRGYLLTGKERYLEPYQSAIARVNQQVDDLRQLTADRPRQQQRIRDLEIAIATKLAELQQTINLRRSRGVEAALRVVQTDRGKSLMDGIRRQVADMEAEENQLLQQRSQESQASANYTLFTFSLATGLNLLLLGLVYYLIERDGFVRYLEEEKQHQLLMQLKESEQKFRQLAENSHEAFWISEPNNSKLIYISPAYEEIWGRKQDELYTDFASWNKAIHPQDRKRVERAFLENALRGTYDEEYRIVRPDGSVRWIRDRGFPVQEASGEVYRVTGLAEDITQRKLAEAKIHQLNETLERRVEERTAQFQEVNQEMEAFTYSVSHDLRAPLRTMQGFAQALLEDYSDCLDEIGQEYTQYIIEGAVQMDTLISDLLAYSRLSRTQINFQPVDLTYVVQEALRQLSAQIEQRRAEVTVDAPLPQVIAHRLTLVQVVTNLLSNAIKFVKPDVPPKVRIYAQEQQNWIRLSIVDNGIGIAPEHQERIFRVFERLHGVEIYPGTGIGLAIVRKGLERMGGRVGVESQPGQGSRFWIELPIIPEHE